MKRMISSFRVRDWVNKNYKVTELLFQHFKLRISPGETCKCPFHDDNRKSAKLYADNALYCFAENKQYTPYNILRAVHPKFEEIEAMVPFDYVADKGQLEGARTKEMLKQVASYLKNEYQRTRDFKDVYGKWCITGEKMKV